MAWLVALLLLLLLSGATLGWVIPSSMKVAAAAPRSPQVHMLGRRQAICRLIAGAACVPFTAAAAKTGSEGEWKSFHAEDGSFSFEYPAEFVAYSKPIRTHKREVNYKSESTRGFELGVVVDPVRLDSLENFGTPQQVGEKVIQVETKKDGYLDAQLLGSSSSKDDAGQVLYTIEYSVSNTHYTSIFIAKLAVKDGALFVMTGKVKSSAPAEYRDLMRRAVSSFRLGQV